tara:strand:+ start:142 stop:840 length:699 start_codon:yes stop_codon:yes gene_type:complete
MTFSIINVIIAALITMCAANLDLGDEKLDAQLVAVDNTGEYKYGWMENRIVVGKCNYESNCFDLHRHRGPIKRCEEGPSCDLSGLPDHPSCRLPSNGTIIEWGKGGMFCTTWVGNMPYCGLMVQEYSHQDISIASSWTFVKNEDNSFILIPNIDNENINWKGEMLYIATTDEECKYFLLEEPVTSKQHDKVVIEQIKQQIQRANVRRCQVNKAIRKALISLFWIFVFGIIIC